MNHNILTKIITYYWKDRLQYALKHIKKNFSILPEPYIAVLYNREYEYPVKSIIYLSLYNYKKNVCNVCNKKYSPEEKRYLKCCVKKIFYPYFGLKNSSADCNVKKYGYLCNNSLIVFEYWNDRNHDSEIRMCNYAQMMEIVCHSLRPEIIESFIP